MMTPLIPEIANRIAVCSIIPESQKDTNDGLKYALPGNILEDARQGDRQRIGELLSQYRNYLLLLATTQIESRLQPRVSPSDIVQETMLKAHRHFAQFRGQSEKELLAW